MDKKMKGTADRQQKSTVTRWYPPDQLITRTNVKGDKPIKATEAAELIGVGKATFIRLIEAREMLPAMATANIHGKRKSQIKYWWRSKIQAMLDDDDVQDAIGRSKQAKNRNADKLADWIDGLPDTHPTPEACIDDVCEYMWSLDRHVVYGCAGEMRDNILDLRQDVLRALDEQGVITKAERYETQKPDLQCFGCNGTGERHWDSGTVVCSRCDGTGIYRKGGAEQWVIMSVVRKHRDYFWLLPADHATWRGGDSIDSIDSIDARVPVAKRCPKTIQAKAAPFLEHFLRLHSRSFDGVSGADSV